MPLFHVMFDREPVVQCHVCRQHKTVVDSLPCDDDKGAHGECEHVQYAICDCHDDQAGCDICLDVGAVMVLGQLSQALGEMRSS